VHIGRCRTGLSKTGSSGLFGMQVLAMIDQKTLNPMHIAWITLWDKLSTGEGEG